MAAEKVWVVAPVGYNQYGIQGIYATLEAAKAAIDWEEWEFKKDEWVTVGADACSECGYYIYEDVVQGADE